MSDYPYENEHCVIVDRINATEANINHAKKHPIHVNQVVEMVSKGGTWYECIEENQFVKPYFDWDCDCETEAEMESLIPVVFDAIKLDVELLFPDHWHYIITANRHGFNGYKNKYKVSFRGYIDGNVKIKMKDLKDKICDLYDRMTVNPKTGNPYLDKSPYGKTQKLNLINCHKGKNFIKGVEVNDERILRPTSYDANYPNKRIHYQDYVVSNVKSDDDIITYINNGKNSAAVNYSHDDALPAKKVKFDQLHKVVMGLPIQHFKSRDDWRNVIYSICYVGRTNDYSRKATNLAHEWSEQDELSYDQKYLDDLIIDANNRGYKRGFDKLCDSLKHHNFELYKVLCMEKPTYKNVKREFERNTFKILNPVCYVTTVEGEDKWSIISRKTLVDKYEHLQFETEREIKGETRVKKESFVRKWVQDADIKNYSRFDFIPPPKVCPSYVFNTWKGFGIEKELSDPNADISIILNHIKLLCNYDEACYDYCIKWLAHMFQKPAELNGVALVFKSRAKGVGKQHLMHFLRDIMDKEYFAEVAKEEDLFGRFSNKRKNKLLINIDEMHVSFSNMEMMKNMITSDVYNHESKGIDPIAMSNFARLIFTTNLQVPVPIEIGDRRVVVCMADDSYANDQNYLTPLVDACRDKKIQRAFYDYLLEQDIEGVNWVNDRPITDEYKDIQSVMIPVIARFLEHFVNMMFDDVVVTTPDAIYESFKMFLVNTGRSKIEKNKDSFLKGLKDYDGVNKVKTNGKMKYTIERDVVFDCLKCKQFNTLDELDDNTQFDDEVEDE